MSHQYNLPRLQSDILIPNTRKPQLAIEYINSYIDSTNCEEFSVDISFMNVIDACYVSAICSTQHYIKYPNGKIHWFVSSDTVKKYIQDMSLGNSIFYSV